MYIGTKFERPDHRIFLQNSSLCKLALQKPRRQSSRQTELAPTQALPKIRNPHITELGHQATSFHGDHESKLCVPQPLEPRKDMGRITGTTGYASFACCPFLFHPSISYIPATTHSIVPAQSWYAAPVSVSKFKWS